MAVYEYAFPQNIALCGTVCASAITQQLHKTQRKTKQHKNREQTGYSASDFVAILLAAHLYICACRSL